MFRVCFLPTGSIFTVYGQNGLMFLVWNDCGEKGFWDWLAIDQCEPIWEG